MKIIKNQDKLYEIIAGEMLNIELFGEYFIDGELRTDLENAQGYPQIKYDNIIDTVKSVLGYIFIPLNVEYATFIDNVSRALNVLEQQVDNNPNIKSPEYYTQTHSYNTSLRERPSNLLQRRLFSVTYEHVPYHIGRFVWIIHRINNIECEITSANIDVSIARFISSIFVDIDDLCRWPHNKIIYEFSKKDMRGYDNLTSDNIILFKNGPPLLYELSDYWKHIAYQLQDAKPSTIKLVKIDRAKIFGVEYKELEFMPDVSSTQCMICKSTLFGENYALGAHIDDITSNYVQPICPLCLHDSIHTTTVEKYARIIKFEAPRSTESMLRDLNISAEHINMRYEALKGVVFGTLKLEYIFVEYALIGDKYAAINCINNYLFTEIYHNSIFAGKKICKYLCV